MQRANPIRTDANDADRDLKLAFEEIEVGDEVGRKLGGGGEGGEV